MTAVTTAPLRGGGAGEMPRPSRVGGFLHRHPGLRLGALLSAPLAWVVVLYLGSLALMFVSAFWSIDDFTGQLVKEFTLDNFEQLFTEPVYRTVAIRTVGVAVVVTLVDALLALPVAFFIVKVVRRRSLRSLLIVSLTLPLWAGYLVKGYSWKIMLTDGGVVDWMLAPFGLHGPGLGLTAVTISLAYLWFPFMALPVVASFERVPDGLLEASADLGATSWTTIRRVLLPLVMPGVVAGSIFTFSLTLGDYIMVKIVGGTTQLFANIVYDSIGVAGNVPFAAAAATLPVLVVVGYLIAVSRTGALENL